VRHTRKRWLPSSAVISLNLCLQCASVLQGCLEDSLTRWIDARRASSCCSYQVPPDAACYVWQCSHCLQGLVHMGKGLITLSPYHTDRQLLSGKPRQGWRHTAQQDLVCTYEPLWRMKKDG
jgi:hypothetical protein